MTSIFTRIIDGEIPARHIWADDHCIAFCDIRPLHTGHALVIPRTEVDEWTDLDASVASHLMTVAHAIAKAQKAEVPCVRVGLLIAGFEIPHTHVHVVPIDDMSNLDFARADTDPDPASLDAIAEALRRRLRTNGHGEHVPG